MPGHFLTPSKRGGQPSFPNPQVFSLPPAPRISVLSTQNTAGLPKQGPPEIPIVAQWVTNPISIHEDVGSIPGLAQGVKVKLWLWGRLAAAAPI